MNPTKEELNEAIFNLKLLIEGDWKLSRPIQKTIITILTRYRDGELVEKEYLIDSIEKTLNPKYMNDVFTWNEILKAISPTPPTNQTER